MAGKPKQNYIDNVLFAEHMAKHHEKVLAAKEAGESPKVPVSNYIGECFYKIATKLSLRPNFIGYSYREEMVSDALEVMLSNAHHFNPNATTRGGKPNPFSYFTLVAWRAFVHRINREKRQEYVKYKVTEQATLLGSMSHGGSDSKGLDGAVDLNTDYYKKLAAQFEKPPKEKKVALEKFLGE